MKFIYMKIKEILIYIGIIILILVGGYLKKDQINIIEGNVGSTGGTLNVYNNLTLKGCEEKCNNTCTCKTYLWKKGNDETKKHECILSTELITDANPDYKQLAAGGEFVIQNNVMSTVSKMNFPQNPKFIFTSYALKLVHPISHT